MVDAGERRFRQLCSGCHGARGEGGQGEGHGPNLAASWEVRRLSNAQLSTLIRSGVRGTSMPPFALPEEQITEITAFVRSLNSPAISVSVPGRPEVGRALFMGKGGCVSCHMVNGAGGYLGPDLSNAGATQRLDELRNAILKPKARASNGFRSVRLKTPEGAVRGVIKHESTWSMQVVDERGKLHLLRGADMKNVDRVSKSWMPDDLAQRFTKEEIDDLVAFLSRLSVRRETPND